MQAMQAENCRFLAISLSDGLWHEVDDNRARHKASQQLRESRIPIRRREMSTVVVSASNNDNYFLPLLPPALGPRHRYLIALLLIQRPEAVHEDERYSDVKLFGHLLGCLTLTDQVLINRQERLSTMFQLLRARPDIISSVDMTTPEMQRVVDGIGGDSD